MARVPKKKVPFKVYGPLALLNDGVYNAEVLATTKSLDIGSAQYQILDPGATDAPVLLPSASNAKGLWFEIQNTTTGTSVDLLIREVDAATDVATLNPREKTKLICDGTSWLHLGIVAVTTGTA